jgi:hypothetical protein
MKFVFLFHGGIAPQSEGEKYIQAFRSWTGELAQKGILKGGLPLARSGKIVSQNSVESFQLSQDSVSGYAEVEAASLDEAIEIAKGCPSIHYGGKVEVRDLMNMPGM